MDLHKVRIAPSYGWLLLILIAAVFLRLYDIAGTPPGLTHDEADHGLTAWEIMNGARQIYFTVGYGREPLFDYSTAALMSLIGPTFLAARMTAVFFSLLLIAAQFVWVRQTLDNNTALLSTAGLAVSFWSVMSSRQSLRSITLPTLFVFAVYFFWLGLQGHKCRMWRFSCSPFVIAGALLGLTFYTYIPARVMWLVFPLTLGHLAVVNRASFRQAWPGTMLMLLLAASIAMPLFSYLYTHPTEEVRIDQLSAPLTALLRGDPGPIWANSIASLRLFTVFGDTFWRYNIPGKPLLPPVMGGLFYLGLIVAAWRSLPLISHRLQSTAYAGALIWLVVGLSPALVTGPELSMTQAIGMQPILYLFPALGITFLGQLLFAVAKWLNAVSQPIVFRRWFFLAPLTLFTVTGIVTARDYFISWATAPELRVQYETTMVAAMHYLNSHPAEAVAVSTIAPGRFHSPAVAQMTLRNRSLGLRWFDGRSGLVLPTDRQSLIIESGFAQLSPLLTRYFQGIKLVANLPLPVTDQDRPLNVYRVNGPELSSQWLQLFSSSGGSPSEPISFGDVAEFLGHDLLTPVVKPGEQVQLVTLWRVKRALEDALLFVHVQGAAGVPVAQVDKLSVPGHSWYPGDLFLQLHQFELPPGIMAGTYPVVIGLCQQSTSSCDRLPILNGPKAGNTLFLAELVVSP